MYFPIYYNLQTKECSLEYHDGWVEIYPLRGDGSDGRWRWGKERVGANLMLLEPFYSNIAKRWGINTRVYLSTALQPITREDVQNNDEDEEEIIERVSKSKSFWMGGELSSDVGRRQLKALFTTPYFDYPKSVDYILNTLYMGSSDDSIVLDFFSGSATTAHAVMQLNAEDGGHRKFVMVQLPEKCDEQSEAYKAGYKNICEIGKERIRRAGDKIKADSPLTTQDLDIGFRVFKLDDTNMTDVYYRADEYNQSMLSMLESNVKPDRNDLDLLFGCLLEWGLPLSLPYTSEQMEGCTVHTYNDGDLIACFDENIPDSVIKEIARRQPLRAVFRDSSFANSPAKINVGETFKMLAPDTRVKVL
jgi:adenine-specific DNA-methyltransferase